MPVEKVRIPVATYRLQLNKKFTFNDARALVPYLDRLGISDLYISPIFKARRGSLHGYDGVDYNEINPELGTDSDFLSLVSELRRHKMGLMLDMVPNHMGIGEENKVWMDVLEYGESSPYANFFDVDWSKVGNPPNKVFLPILGERWNDAVASGKVRITFERKTGQFFILLYNERRFPLSPRSYNLILECVMKTFDYLPKASRAIERITNSTNQRNLHKSGESLKSNLKEICKLTGSQSFFKSISRALRKLNFGQDRMELFNELMALQFYVFGHWQEDASKINYRRFFEVNELAAVRVEESKVFLETHRLLLRLLASGKATGLRVDHPDGLRDPSEYFVRIEKEYEAYKRKFGKHHIKNERRPLYVIAEKVLMENESLRKDWRVYGTTGYDFTNDLNQLSVYPNERSFDQIYEAFTGERKTFASDVYKGKRTALRLFFQSELSSLTHRLYEISSRSMGYKDLKPPGLSLAISEAIVNFPVYRTYIGENADNVTREDYRVVNLAIGNSRKIDPKARRLLGRVLLLSKIDGTVTLKQERDFVLKFQQLTGPVMAKGVEDTAFYTYNRLCSLNEVGGNPARFGSSVERFHLRNLARKVSWPHSMLATSTHDTKRSEDVRARINVLSEIPEKWSSFINWAAKINQSKKLKSHGRLVPGRNDEYLLYQTLLGAFPISFGGGAQSYETFVNRIVAYMRKASKEAKENTSWTDSNEEYDRGLESFVRSILANEKSNKFLKRLQSISPWISYFGMLNSLSSTLLKVTLPGVADFYQGNESWDYSLVDPDNRRIVDFARLEKMQSSLLRSLKRVPLQELCKDMLDAWEDGSIKMFVTYQALQYRSMRNQLFSDGDYTPLSSEGPRKDSLCAFARTMERETCIVACPRFFAETPETKEGRLSAQPNKSLWEETKVLLSEKFPKKYRNLFTGESVSSEIKGKRTYIQAAKIFQTFPVALLTSES